MGIMQKLDGKKDKLHLKDTFSIKMYLSDCRQGYLYLCLQFFLHNVIHFIVFMVKYMYKYMEVFAL